MVLSSVSGSLITQDQLDDINDDYERNAAVMEIMSRPIDPLTSPELLAEYRVARES